jgi:predicted metal-binding protein
MFPQAPCRLCKNCTGTEECRQPYQSRPTLEAFGVDVYSTARMLGYPIQVVKDYQDEMNRYGLLLVE